MLPDPHEFDDLLFDPEMGHVVREPTGKGYGYWVGGHKVFYAQASKQFVIFYRERTPLETGREDDARSPSAAMALLSKRFGLPIRRHSPRRRSKSATPFVRRTVIGGFILVTRSPALDTGASTWLGEIVWKTSMSKGDARSFNLPISVSGR